MNQHTRFSELPPGKVDSAKPLFVRMTPKLRAALNILMSEYPGVSQADVARLVIFEAAERRGASPRKPTNPRSK